MGRGGHFIPFVAYPSVDAPKLKPDPRDDRQCFLNALVDVMEWCGMEWNDYSDLEVCTLAFCEALTVKRAAIFPG